MQNKSINLIVLGHVGAGKATTVGTLIKFYGKKLGKKGTELAEHADEINYDQMLHEFKSAKERGSDEILLHLSTDQNTINIIDTPGHRDFVENMITGRDRVDCGLAVISCKQGEYEDQISNEGYVLEQIRLGYNVGMSQLIVCINKIDEINYEKSRFVEITNDITQRLSVFSFKSLQIIPISSLRGDNITSLSEHTQWYKQATLAHSIQQLTPNLSASEKSLRIVVQETFNINGIGTVISGKVETGILKPPIHISFSPSNLVDECLSIQMMHDPSGIAQAGDITGFQVKNLKINDIAAGEIVSNAHQNTAIEVTQFESHLIVLSNKIEIRAKETIIVHCHNLEIPCQIDTLHQKIDKRTVRNLEANPTSIKLGESGIITLVPSEKFSCEEYKDFPSLGTFIIKEEKEVLAVGIVTKAQRAEKKKRVI